MNEPDKITEAELMELRQLKKFYQDYVDSGRPSDDNPNLKDSERMNALQKKKDETDLYNSVLTIGSKFCPLAKARCHSYKCIEFRSNRFKAWCHYFGE